MFRNNPQLLVIVIFFALSGLSWAVNKAREQKQIKQARDAQRRRREEELRTGRADEGAAVGGSSPPSPPPPTMPPLPSLQELAAKRQRQLEELRARQQARAREGGRPGPVARPIPGSTTVRQAPPSAPSAPRPMRAAPPTAVPTPRPIGTPARGAKPPAGAPTRGRGGAKRKPIVIGSAPATASVRPPAGPRRVEEASAGRGLASRPSPAGDDIGESSTKGLLTNLHAESMGVAAETTNPVDGRMLSRGSLRRAIIMSEVLSPPVSLREGF